MKDEYDFSNGVRGKYLRGRYLSEHIQHVVPVNDLRPHENDFNEGPPCWCKPKVEEVPGGLVVIHNSMDRREEYEEGRKPS